jgi:hypothetical protein
VRAVWLARFDAFGRLWRMWGWSTAASLATALGTLVLALATFVAVRAAKRAARTAEYGLALLRGPALEPGSPGPPLRSISLPTDTSGTNDVESRCPIRSSG